VLVLTAWGNRGKRFTVGGLEDFRSLQRKKIVGGKVKHLMNAKKRVDTWGGARKRGYTFVVDEKKSSGTSTGKPSREVETD